MKNPAKLLQLKRQWDGFAGRHPKFLRYLAYITDNYLEDGTVLDMTVTDTKGRALHSNARLTPEDVAFLREIKTLLSNKE